MHNTEKRNKKFLPDAKKSVLARLKIRESVSVKMNWLKSIGLALVVMEINSGM